MITDELLEKYYINKDFFTDNDILLYQTFLERTDYVANKIAEAMFLDIQLDEDYTEIFHARQFAREQINILHGEQEEGTA